MIDGKHIDLTSKKDTQVFVVQHDWAAAFKDAQDFDGGDYALPFDEVCFELRISGKRVCAIIREEAGIKYISTFIEMRDGWKLPIPEFPVAEGLPNFGDAGFEYAGLFGEAPQFVADQAKAICVSLEAEVASFETVVADRKLNAARVRRGKEPLPPYHLLTLNRKPRAHMIASSGDGTGPRKRLHFRRGHRRHISEDRTTWVRWCLVGDPDLGFIEKQYRL